jgi:DNA replication protein DnaC
MSNQPEMSTPDTPQLLLEHHLKVLRLPTILREYDKVARQCAVEKTDFPRYLLRLTELELLDRDRRATERRIRQARFPVVKSLDSFDFLAIPSLNKTLVLELARCEFLARKENVLLLGNSGTGKSPILRSRWAWLPVSAGSPRTGLRPWGGSAATVSGSLLPQHWSAN